MSASIITQPAEITVGTVHRIRELAADLEKLGKTALEKAIEAGTLLRKCKASLAHGTWLPWLEENFAFTDRTARNWMRISEASASGKLETVSDLSEAYRIATEPKERLERSPIALPRIGERLILLSPIHGDLTVAAFEPMDEAFMQVSWIKKTEVLSTRRGIRRDYAWHFLVSQSQVNWQRHLPVYTQWEPTSDTPLFDFKEIEEGKP